MDTLEPGCYVCVQTKTLFGWLIRIATRSWADHAALCIGSGQIIQATPRKGVHVSPLSDYAGCKAAASTAQELTGTQRAAVVAAARAYVGTEYGWPQIGADALALLGWHWKLLLRITRADRLLICSQTVAAAGVDAGISSWLCGKPDPSLVTPADLAAQPWMRPITIPA